MKTQNHTTGESAFCVWMSASEGKIWCAQKYKMVSITGSTIQTGISEVVTQSKTLVGKNELAQQLKISMPHAF